jgi:hypothetical protein
VLQPSSVTIDFTVHGAFAARDDLIVALAHDLAVVLDARGVRAEHVAVLPIEEPVDEHTEAISVVERRVAAAIGGDDRERLGVVSHHADVERAVREAHEDLSALARRLPVRRLDL